ncbi:MAG: hypothetical protein CMJ18_01085, partial [Phycisphaeraceae bacterium]|nr:hypothetical protein [Phycisphaeraceae bacterium]
MADRAGVPWAGLEHLEGRLLLTALSDLVHAGAGVVTTAPGDGTGGFEGASVVTVQEDADLVYLANHVAQEELAAMDRVGASLLTLYSRQLQADAARGPAPDHTIAGTPYASFYTTLDGVPHVQAFVDDVDTAQPALEALGLQVSAVTDTDDWQVVAGFLPVAAVGDAAQVPGLVHLAPTERPYLNSEPDYSVTLESEGSFGGNASGNGINEWDELSGAEQVRRILTNVTGAGIDVGVLSDSINQVGAGVGGSQATGDLPAGGSVQILDDTAQCTNNAGNVVPCSDEGRAMAELVCDLGPDLDIIYHTAFISPANFAQGITDLRNAGADVITDDISWFGEPFFTDGQIANAVDGLNAFDIPYFSSAGNRNDESYLATWSDTDTDNYHRFSGGGDDETINLTLGNNERLRVFLQWDNAWGNAITDIDIEVWDSGVNNKLADSNTNNIGGNPFDSLSFTNTTGGAASFHLSFRYVSGTDPRTNGTRIHMAAPQNDDDFTDNYVQDEPGIFGHNGPDLGFGVGAVPWDTPGTIEDFSSRGPRPRRFDTLNQPIITAADGTETTVPGFINFFGTSAAAPNAAAVAALMAEAAGGARSLSFAETRDIMIDTAVGTGVGAWDATHGNGRVSALGAVMVADGVEFGELAVELNQFGDASVSNSAFVDITSNSDVERLFFALDTSGSTTITAVENDVDFDLAAILWNDETNSFIDISYDDSGDDPSFSRTLSLWTQYQVEVFAEEDMTGVSNTEFTLNVNGPTPLVSAVTLDGEGDGTGSGSISNEDSDYFEFTAPLTSTGDLDLDLDVTSAGLNAVLTLFDASGNQLVRANSGSGGVDESISYSGIVPGATYAARVGSVNYASTGNYSLDVNFELSLPTEWTAFVESFATIHSDGFSRDILRQDAFINSATDRDSYYFASDSAGSNTITVDDLGNAVDPVVAVYDASSGALLGFDDNSGPGSDAQLTLSLSGFTRYILAVADADRTNAGDVAIEIDTPTSVTAPNIPIAGDGSGQLLNQQINSDADTDFYRFTAPVASTEATITVTPADGALQLDAVLFDAAGSELSRDLFTSVGTPTTFTYTGFTPGTEYFLSVHSHDYASNGDFDVAVQFEVLGEIKGVKFHDLNDNGVQDSGEPGLEGWQIYLDNNRNNERDPGEPSTLTDAFGNYSFDVRAGNYTVAEVPQDGWVPTAPMGAFYATDRTTDDVYLIDPATGASSLLGNMGLNTSLSGLSFNGQLFASDVNDPSPNVDWSLASVDTHTGAGTVLGDHVNTNTVQALVHVDGTLYGFVVSPSEIGIVDETTGEYNPLFTTFPTDMTGADIDESNGTVYALGDDDNLYIIDVSDGSWTLVGATGVNFGENRSGLAWNPIDGQLYAIGDNNIGGTDNFYRINKHTGRATFVSATPIMEGDALEFVMGGAVFIDFETFPGFDGRLNTTDDVTITAPNLFSQQTLQITEQYASVGVHFVPNPPTENVNEILNDSSFSTQSGSSPNILASNLAASNAISAFFDYPVYELSMALDARSGNRLTVYADTALTQPLGVVDDQGGITSVRSDVPIRGFVVSNQNSQTPALDDLLIKPAGAHTVVVGQGAVVNGVDFGNLELTGSISGVKFIDDDGDGVRDAGEPGLPGVVIYLDLNNNGALDTGEPRDTTDSAGTYTFTGLRSGVTYVVAEVGLPGWTQTTNTIGVNGAIGGITTENTGTDRLLTLTPPSTTTTGPNIGGGHVMGAFAFDYNAQTLYGISILGSQDTLVTVDRVTGLASAVGSGLGAGLSNTQGLAFDSSTEQLYSVDLAADRLLRINPATGAATVVGALGFSAVGYLAYDPNADVLYGYDFLARDLVTINRATGAASFVGDAGVSFRDLAFDPVSNTLLGLEQATKEIWSIDTGTADTTSLAGPFNVSSTNSFELLHRLGTRVVTLDIGDDAITGVDFGNQPDRLDFGDAPDPYPTLLADDGARHALATGQPILGPEIDFDADGQPSAGSDGDDIGGIDDEDGVTLGIFEASNTATIRITNTGGTGLVSAWIDHNQDGDWADAGEQVITDRSAPGAGASTNMSFLVPSSARLGNTQLRVRISTQRALSYDGIAFDGEVEDYEIRIDAPPPAEIHGLKFEDLNENGIRDAGEPGLEGWTIYLDDNRNGVRDPGEPATVTDANGEYWLMNVDPGVHRVAEEPQPGWEQTFPAGGPLTGVDFEFRGGRSPFGWLPLDSSQTPVVLKNLHDEAGNATSADLTIDSNDGGFGIDDARALPPFVPVHTNPLGDLGSNAVFPTNAVFDYTDLLPSTEYEVYVFGLDTRINKQDVMIRGEGAPVTFTQTYDTEELVVNREFGDSTRLLGTYRQVVTSTTSGRIQVVVDEVSGTQVGIAGIAIRPVEEAGTYTVELESGEVITGIDFGNVSRFGEIRGAKWEDINGNGVRDAGEPGLEGWTVFIDEDADGELDPGEHFDVTDSNGDYGFVDVPLGSHRVTEVVDAPQRANVFVDAGVGGLALPRAILFADDGTVLVGTQTAGVLRYNGSGGFIEQFIANGPEVNDISEMVVGPDGNLYVASRGNHRILRYNAQTGAFLGVFADGGGIQTPVSLAFSPHDGNLYVVSAGTDQVLRYDGHTGQFVDVFATVTGASALAFGPDGNLYVANNNAGDVERFNGQTGAPLGTFANGPPSIIGIAFGPDGDLYVGNLANRDVTRYDGSTGAFIEIAVSGGLGGLTGPQRLAFGQGGSLFVASYGTGQILEYTNTADIWLPINPAGGVQIVDLDPSEIATDIDFGNTREVSIHGRKRLDVDADGVLEPGEPALEGWRIFLDFDRDGEISERDLVTTTDATGRYWFMELIAGEYVIREIIEPGWELTTPSENAAEVALRSGDVALGVDFGNVPEARVDFGDAPDPTYPTLLSSSGALHPILPGAPVLGELIDGEPDGQPTAAADGDDTDGTDDEDGVRFTTPVEIGNLAEYDVVNSGVAGLLNAWVDFNGDGDWFDSGEQIARNEPVPGGGATTSLSYTVPAGA